MSFSSTLRHKVRIQSRGEPGSDADGNVVTDWVTVAEPYADIRMSGGLETIRAGAVTSAVKASIRIRWRTGITAGMRVLHGATAYNILAVVPDMEKRVYIDLVSEVIQ